MNKLINTVFIVVILNIIAFTFLSLLHITPHSDLWNLGVIFLFIAILILFFLIAAIIKEWWLNKLPELSVEAIIVNKDIIVKKESNYDGTTFGEYRQTFYKLTFELDSHVQVTLEVPSNIFNDVSLIPY